MVEKVWIYVLSRELDPSEIEQLTFNCKNFVDSWTAHEQKLNAHFEIYKSRLLIFRVDESAYNASGCSIDKLLRFVKEQETQFNLELLNRLLVVLDVDGAVLITHSSKIKDLLATKAINGDTLVYDTAVSSSELLKEWKKPLKYTWLSKYLDGVSTK
jgi:hypothetical protein